eukprot:TRINITY_DN5699_c0_g1_i8.p1 TRINITY_DN5699_c0_g1~~TRINITY_DN5699_c0_g1_i8.p1  ORF type:complete len:193 (-),score=33.28 TRINITY_DN5699_c0_g1_i8:617-1195(-)
MDASLMAHQLIFDCYTACLRICSARADAHYAGLAAASRLLRRQGRISNKMAKKLVHLDSAFNLLRHATTISCKDVVQVLDNELLNGIEGKEKDDDGKGFNLFKDEGHHQMALYSKAKANLASRTPRSSHSRFRSRSPRAFSKVRQVRLLPMTRRSTLVLDPEVLHQSPTAVPIPTLDKETVLCYEATYATST